VPIAEWHTVERVEQAKREALLTLLARGSDAPPGLRVALGLPTVRESRVLAGHLAKLAA
jgi:hypothetical protein